MGYFWCTTTRVLPSSADVLSKPFPLNNHVGSESITMWRIRQFGYWFWASPISTSVGIGAESWLRRMTVNALLFSTSCTSNIGMSSLMGSSSSRIIIVGRLDNASNAWYRTPDLCVITKLNLIGQWLQQARHAVLSFRSSYHFEARWSVQDTKCVHSE